MSIHPRNKTWFHHKIHFHQTWAYLHTILTSCHFYTNEMLIKIHPLHYSLIMLIMSIARTLTFLFQSMAFLNGKASILIFMSVTRTPVFLPQSKAFWNGKAFVFPGWRKPLQTVSPTAGSHRGSTSQGGTVQPEHPMPSCFRSNIIHVWHSLERILWKKYIPNKNNHNYDNDWTYQHVSKYLILI